MADSQPSRSRLINSLTPRYQAKINQIQESLKTKDRAYLIGYLDGLKRAYHLMWPDVETWFKEDPTATRMTLTAMAVEDLIDGMS